MSAATGTNLSSQSITGQSSNGMPNATQDFQRLFGMLSIGQAAAARNYFLVYSEKEKNTTKSSVEFLFKKSSMHKNEVMDAIEIT